MKITHADFEQLTVNSMNWSKHKTDWQLQEGRFEDIDYSEAFQPEVDYTFARAYWIENYTGVMFVKAFLETLGFAYRVYFDSAEDIYMVTTNYGDVI